MPANDAIKPAVVAALVKDGWTITNDPYRIEFGTDDLYVDLGAERVLVGAERGTERIAVEIKSFMAPSLLNEFQTAFGQFLVYQTLMEDTDPERRLFVAVTDRVFDAIHLRPALRRVLEKQAVPFVLIHLDTQEVVRWTS